MGKRLIISENQFKRLKEILTEGNMHSNMVRKIKTELDSNYEPTQKFIRKGGEYFEKHMILIKADNEVIDPKDLFEYLKYKYKVGDDFIKQVIKDWFFSKISDDHRLSKNVTIS